MATAVALEPLIKIRPTSGWRALDLREVWVFRDLLFTLAQRDIKLRYKQTALGVIWVVVQPLIAAAIFAVVFGKIAKMPSDGIPYLLFAYAGLLAWTAFSTTLTRASVCLVSNSQLISKVYFPRLVLPLSTVFSTLIDFGVALGVMALMLVFYGIVPGWGIFLFPLLLLLILMLAIGCGLIASALMVSYRDVQYILPVLIQFLLYASPIAYSVSSVPAHLQTFFRLNPLSSFLEAFRWSLLGRGELNWPALGYSTAVTILVFIFGAFAFRKMEKQFADII